MMDMFKECEALLLDFDGVVVESTDIKTEAFYEIYLPYGVDVALKAKEYHLQNQGVTRSIKIQEIHRLYLNEEIKVKDLNLLCELFSNVVLDNILKCSLVDGIEEFLAKKQDEDIPVFLLSATPHEELLYIITKRHLLSYFKGIYGAPISKVAAGEEIIAMHSFDKSKIIFIGDSISDYLAATELGVPFIGRVQDLASNSFFRVPTIRSFDELI